jgi:membrane-bound inhibitor of C-type lysozyme
MPFYTASRRQFANGPANRPDFDPGRRRDVCCQLAISCQAISGQTAQYPKMTLRGKRLSCASDLQELPVLPKALVAIAIATVTTSPALADAGVTLGLALGGNTEIKTVQYTCKNHDPVTMQYVNAEPNFLAVLPLDGKSLIFVSVLAASGTKYVSGQYQLFSKGPEITLQDATEGLDAAPLLQCTADDLAP